MGSIWGDFKAFLLRGNMLELAVAFIIGTAFAGVVRSLATDILLPPVALAIGDADFTDRFSVLQDGTPAGPYTTLADAQAAGAIVMSYGVFINVLITFLLTALVIFLIVRYVRRMSELRRREAVEAPPPEIKDCAFCMSKIDIRATRCAFCTAELPA